MNIWSVWKTRNKRRKRLQCPVSCIVTKATPSVAERNFAATRFQLVNIQRKRCYRQQLIRVSRRSNKNIWKIKPGFRQLLLAMASRHRSSHLAKYLPCSVSVSPCNVCKSTSWLLHGQVVNLWFPSTSLVEKKTSSKSFWNFVVFLSCKLYETCRISVHFEFSHDIPINEHSAEPKPNWQTKTSLHVSSIIQCSSVRQQA